MKELTLEEAKEALEDLVLLATWERLSSFVKENFEGADTFQVFLNYDAYNDTNYYTTLDRIEVYNKKGNTLYPKGIKIQWESSSTSNEVSLLPEYSEAKLATVRKMTRTTKVLLEDWESDVASMVKMNRENSDILGEGKYSLNVPPKTKYTKLFAE